MQLGDGIVRCEKKWWDGMGYSDFIGKNVYIFYVETNGSTFRKEGKIIDIKEGLIFLDEIKDGLIAISISRIGKMGVM
jgi:hypothetical protein